MYPVDTVKTRVQFARGAAVRQWGAAVGEGHFYRGVGFSLVGQIPYGMLTFGLYETLCTELERRAPKCPKWLQIVLAASLGDSIGSMWLTPSEVVKSKLQAGLYPSAPAAARAIAGRSGIAGFYQGYGAALARDVPFRAIQLTLYENARAWYAKHLDNTAARAIQPLENLLIGAIVGTVTAACTTPLDVVRTRMMSQIPGSAGAYASAVDCVVQMVRSEGPRALLKGIAPRCLLLGPSSAIFFLAYESARSFFRSRRRQIVVGTAARIPRASVISPRRPVFFG